MEIQYDVCLDDYVCFNQYFCAHSPFIRRRRLLSMVFGPIAFLFVGIVISRRDQTIAPLAIFGVLAMLWLALFPRYWDWEIGRRSRRLYSEGNADRLSEKCSLRIDEEGLHTSGDKGDGNLKWSAVEKVVETDGHLFIFVGPASALMVPRRAFAGRDTFDEFATRARALREASVGLNPVL